jgi:hypothetical protein
MFECGLCRGAWKACGQKPEFPTLNRKAGHSFRANSCLNSSVYCFRDAFVILVSLSLLKQLAKGYVLRGQGHSRLVQTQIASTIISVSYMLHFLSHVLHLPGYVLLWIEDALPEVSNLVLAVVGVVMSLPKLAERIEDRRTTRYAVAISCFSLGFAGFLISVNQRQQANVQMTTLVNNANISVTNTTDLVTKTNSVVTQVGAMLPQVVTLNSRTADIKLELESAKGDPEVVAFLQRQAAMAKAQADASSRQLLLAMLSGVVHEMKYWEQRWGFEDRALRNQIDMLHSDRPILPNKIVDERISELKSKRAGLGADYSKQVIPVMTNANFLRFQLFQGSETTPDEQRGADILTKVSAGEVITWADMRLATDYMANLATKH